MVPAGCEKSRMTPSFKPIPEPNPKKTNNFIKVSAKKKLTETVFFMNHGSESLRTTGKDAVQERNDTSSKTSGNLLSKLVFILLTM